MARPERPLDPAAGPVQRLAHELRELRRAAGNPSYRTMADTAGFAQATLSKAASGTRLPSFAVVQGYVRACGGDPGAWEPRWKEAEAAAAGQERRDAADTTPPYRGLARFEPADREVFFGRDRLVAEVLTLVREHRFAAVFGASGSGKSSLLRAGLIPRLRERVQPGGDPAVLRVLAPGPRPASTYGHLLRPAPGEPESWVVVDQFEELFTRCQDRAERDEFIDLLLAARDPGSGVRVLVAVRADFYARCAEHRGLADALRGADLLIGPMTADELREAVVRPAQSAGLLVERELTARLVAETLDEPGGLPMLSHALLETWRRRRGRALTLAAYEAAGGVRGSIAATAEATYARLTPRQARTARHLLLRLVEPGRDAPDTRRPLTRTELAEWAEPEVRPVVDELSRARLLTVDEDGVQLAHEALITCWPRLQGWIEESRERLRHQRRLADATHAWLEHDRCPGALYRGTRLARAEELFASDDGQLTAPERAFLTSALDARASEARAAARSARRSRALLATLSAVLTVAVFVGLGFWHLRRDDQWRRTEAAARRVAEVSDAMRTTDPRTAQLLGVAAWRIAESPETRRALLGALTQPETDTLDDPAPGTTPFRFLTRSGRTLLSAGDGTWRTWDVASHHRLASGRLPDGTVVEAGPDGRLLLIARGTGTRLWDTSTGHWTGRTLPAHANVTFTPDGHAYVVIAPGDTTVRLYAARDAEPLFATRTPAVPVSVAASTGGKFVTVCSPGRAPQVWDTARDRTLPGAWRNANARCDEGRSALVFGGPGAGADRFALATTDGVRVWDTGSGRRLADFGDRGVSSVAFSADGAFLATVDGNEIRAWRVGPAAATSAVAAPVFRHSLNNERPYGFFSWDPGRPLLRYLEGGTVHTLDLTGTVDSAWRDTPLDTTLLSPDSRTLATAERTTTGYRFRLFDAHDGHVLRTLPPLPVPRTGRALARATRALLAFSPGSDTLAYGVSAPGVPTAPQRVALWDLVRDHPRTTLDLTDPASEGTVTSLALGPNGRSLYAVRTPTTGEPGDEEWDIARHRRTAVFRDVAGTDLAVSPDGRLLVGADHVVRLPLGPVRVHGLVRGDGVGALAFAQDGSLLAVGDRAGRVTLWDGSLEHRAGVLRTAFPAPLGASAEAVSALAVSPDGRTLAVGGDAGTLQLWDIATQQPLGDPLTTPGDAISSLAFAPDSTTVYATGAHAPLQRYDIRADRAVDTICARTGEAELTRAQWHTYVPDAPYREVCGH